MGTRSGGGARGGLTGNESKATVFPDYKDALAKAQAMADRTGREVGIEKRTEFGREVYSVKHLPDAANRYGYEARMEVVAPRPPEPTYDERPWNQPGARWLGIGESNPDTYEFPHQVTLRNRYSHDLVEVSYFKTPEIAKAYRDFNRGGDYTVVYKSLRQGAA